ncbi:MAG: hypothetical protein U9N53_01915 [Bacteroidota bacterium]|nr:hypothetical protein [Bacteroidota bacterium]
MKNLIYLFLAIFLLSGCGSSKKQLQKGNYDSAIQKAVKKLMKNPNSDKDIEALDKSYMLANERDNDRIQYLKREGKPENWEEIVQTYERLLRRQQKVRPVLPLELNGRSINYPQIDYDHEIIEAKHQAAQFFFAHGQKLMSNQNKESYRQAYYEFLKVKQYWGDYENIDALIGESRYLGMSRAIVTVENFTHLKLPTEFTDQLLAVSPQDLDTEWVEFFTRDLNKDINYNYHIKINLKIIAVSPDNIKETDRLEKKTIENGFSYALDPNGNVMKDTAGNDIKIIKYKDISCSLIETAQSKSSHIEGNVEIYELNPAKLMRNDPIGADSHFEHFSARAIGNQDALSPESLAMVESDPLPFPSDEEMIFQCSEALKMAIRGILQRNKHYIY